MNRSRPFRLVAALIALTGMLFMQLAMASYDCPGLKTAQAGMAMTADAADQGMAGCQGMDKDQPGMCQAHDQAGNQSLDKPDMPQVPPFLATGLALTVIPLDVVDRPDAAVPDLVFLTRATAPPLAIRHCCFRI